MHTKFFSSTEHSDEKTWSWLKRKGDLKKAAIIMAKHQTDKENISP